MRSIKFAVLAACFAAFGASASAQVARGVVGGAVPGSSGLSVPVVFQNTSGSPTSASYVTTGQGFKDGDISTTDSIVLDCSASGGGANIYVQRDNLATWPSGKVRHAALTAIMPGLNANETKSCNWKIGSATAPSPSAPTVSAILASSYDVQLAFNYFIPTPSSPSKDPASFEVRVSCQNANGESLASIPNVGLNAGATLSQPVCGATMTGWNYYINGHKQGGTLPTSTLSVTIPASPTTTGVAPPTTNTASIDSPETANCKTILQNANTAGTVRTFFSGPAVNEFDAYDYVHSSGLRIRCHIRAYADGNFQTDVIFDNTWFKENKPSQFYGVTISHNGVTDYTYTGTNQVNQYLYTFWHRRVYTSGLVQEVEDAPGGTRGPLNIKANYAYLRSAGLLPSWDTSYTTLMGYNTSIDTKYNAYYATPPQPMTTGYLATDLSTAGGRQDIGLHPDWNVQWIMTGDYRARVNGLGQADAFSSYPGQFTDTTPGTVLPINANTYQSDSNPTVPAGGVNCTVRNGLCQNGVWGTTWNADSAPGAHMPNTSTMPYLLTASSYRLLQMQYQYNYTLVGTFMFGICFDNATGTIHMWQRNLDCPGSSQQMRAESWGLKQLAEVAAFTPDNDPLKTYFKNIYNDEIKSQYNQTLVSQVTAPWGALKGWFKGDDQAQIPFEENYEDLSTMEAYRLNPGDADAQTKLAAYINYRSNGWQGNVYFQGSPSGALGNYPMLDATAYVSYICTSGPTCATNGGVGAITTWSGFYTQNADPTCTPDQRNNCNHGIFVVPVPAPIINFACCGPQFGEVAGAMGGYAEAAGAAAINRYGLTQNPRELQIYAYTTGRSLQAYQILGANWEVDAGITQMFLFAPKVSSGNYLDHSRWKVEVATAAPNLTPPIAGDALLDCVDTTGTTCTMSGNTPAVPGATVVMTCDQITAGKTCTMTASAGEITIMTGAWGGTNTFNDDTGNNYMWGSPSSGTNAFVFGGGSSVNNSGQDTIVNFRPGTDIIKIKANLDGSSVATAAQVAALCANSGADTVCNFGGGNTITIKGQNGAASTWFQIF